MPRKERPEVLSPAGDRERLEAALRYGADAVYLSGTEFGMRASPKNFTPEGLADAVSYAHARGARVYLTCNTVPTNAEAQRLPEHLKEAAACGVDAFIVADVGVLAMAKRAAPQVEVHISTQAGIVNYATATELYHMGASRTVLARELSLEDIRTIRERTPPELELECFVHGAMCLSFSGRCLLSHYMMGRDANRGECVQPCRWGYYLMEEKRPGEYYPVYEDERGSYILNAKDLCMIEHLGALAGAGVNSFKIEGRAKSAYYVAVVTNAYRLAVDTCLGGPVPCAPEPWIVEETRRVSHREYSTGFYFGRPENGQCYQSGGYVREYDVAAVVEHWENGVLTVTQRNRFFPGDELEALIPGEKPFPLRVERILDETGEALDSARHPMQRLTLSCARSMPEGSILRRAATAPPAGSGECD